MVLHLDVEAKAAGLHLGPALTDAERRYLSEHSMDLITGAKSTDKEVAKPELMTA